MARAFGKDKDDDENDKSKKSEPNKKQGGASWNGQSCTDEGDSTEPVPIMHDPVNLPEEIREDAVEGQHLYLSFVRSEIERVGMSRELQCFDRTNDQTVTDIVDPQRLMDWTRAGQELRQLADAFSRSKERESVRKRAQTLTLDSLDFDNFVQLLQELFNIWWYLFVAFSISLSLGGGITRERILVLFFFCADVAIEALRRGFHRTFHQLLSWSLRYIATSVAQYVHSVGGWGVVLRQSLDVVCHLTACCAFVLVAAACVVYIRRNLS